jgi:hypothetical protein
MLTLFQHALLDDPSSVEGKSSDVAEECYSIHDDARCISSVQAACRRSLDRVRALSCLRTPYQSLGPARSIFSSSRGKAALRCPTGREWFSDRKRMAGK